MKRLSRYLPIFLLIGAFLLCLPAAGLAGTYDMEDGSITITATASGQTVSQDGNIYTDAVPIIQNKNKDTSTANTITVSSSGDAVAKLTLSGVNISVGDDVHAINIGASKAQITLAEGSVNTLKAVYGSAIHVTGNLSLVGSGTLNAESGSGTAVKQNATIGSEQGEAFDGTMTFGGNVTVSVANVGHGAAIGSGYEGVMSGHITITENANIVNAGARNGAAIGSGMNGAMSGHITITENATITEASGRYGAAIGSGALGAMSGHILINTSNAVNAKSVMSSGSIGAGQGASMAVGSTITIGSTGTVTAQSGEYGVGIGVGNNSGNETMAGTITIQDSVTVKAYGGKDTAAAIGSALQGNMTGTINILGTAKVITGNTNLDSNYNIISTSDYTDGTNDITGIIGDGYENYHNGGEGQYVIATSATLNGHLATPRASYENFVNFTTEDDIPTNLTELTPWDLKNGSITVTVDAAGKQWVQYTNDDNSKQQDDTAWIMQSDNGTTTANTITVNTPDDSDYVAKLTLDGVNVSVGGSTHAINIGASKAQITLAANSVNTLNTWYGSAIHVTGNLSLVGSGKLNAENTYGGGGENAAAIIGSGTGEAFGGTMTFGDKVTVSASNNGFGAAIGSGFEGVMSGHITITGNANIQNASASVGAAIGSGAYGAMNGHITITENAAITEASASNGAAIGSGDSGVMNGHILINTSNAVNAKSVMYTGSIGAGACASMAAGSTITIGDTGTVTAQSGGYGVGIGVGRAIGSETMAGTITIQDGVTVKAYGGKDTAAAIGSATQGKMEGTINILGTAKVITGNTNFDGNGNIISTSDYTNGTNDITGIIGDGYENYHNGGKGQYVIATSATLNGRPATPRSNYENFVNFTTEDDIPTNLTEITPWDLKNGSITVTVDAAGKQWVQYTNDDNSKQQDDIAWIMQSDNGTATANTITVNTPDDSEHMAKLTLDGVNVSVGDDVHAINIGASKAQITLAEGSENTLKAVYGSAIRVAGNLTLVGSGRLNAESKGERIPSCATIGSGSSEAFGGTMTFGDKVTVSVSNTGHGAAIGSGLNGAMSGHITITGEANIQNASAYTGAAIGSGDGGAMSGHIIITENATIVNASAYTGAAIGSGAYGAMSGHILINTSKSVNAKSGMVNGSIGAGRGASMAVGSTITIGSTGTVTAQSGRFGVGIGVGYNSTNDVMAGTITIQDSVTVKAYGGKDTAAAIGSALQGNMTGTINILGTAKVITGNTNLDSNYNIISTSDYTDGTNDITGIIGDGYENYHNGGEGQYVIATSATLNGNLATPRASYENFVNFTIENDTPTNLTELTPWDLKNGSITVTVDAAGKQWVQYTNDDNSKQQDDIAWIMQSDNGTATANTITVETPDDSDYVAKLTLSGVNISVGDDVHAINIGASKAQITLAANSVNTLKAVEGSAIHVTGNLTLVGSGRLNAVNGVAWQNSAATIGSGIGEAFGGTMTFGDKVIVSVSNNGWGAVIGSGYGGAMSGHITITGEANIQNASAADGAAIGSGAFEAMNGHITITENANITEASSLSGAAIGSGSGGAMNGHILINTSNAVNAKSTTAGGGIGAGQGGGMAAGSTITIGDTGTVTAQSGGFGVGIGVGYNTVNDVMAGTITIQDSVTVKAYGGTRAAAIGSAWKGNMTGTINILGTAKVITGNTNLGGNGDIISTSDYTNGTDGVTGIIGDGNTNYHNGGEGQYVIATSATLNGHLATPRSNYENFVNFTTEDDIPTNLTELTPWDLKNGSITVTVDAAGKQWVQYTNDDNSKQQDDTAWIMQSDNGTATANTITVNTPDDSEHMAKLTLDGVNVNVTDRNMHAIDIGASKAQITLAANSVNTLNTRYGSAIHVTGNLSLVGSGTLNAESGSGTAVKQNATIGSEQGEAFGGTMTFGDKVTVSVSNTGRGAAIGSGGYGEMSGHITITENANIVNASSDNGAAIGSGDGGEMSGHILINTSKSVNAKSKGYNGSIGAGKGGSMAAGSTITIGGTGTVTAQSGRFGVGIGVGNLNYIETMAGTITIQDSVTVKAYGGKDTAAAIGSAKQGNMTGTINILGTAKVITGNTNLGGNGDIISTSDYTNGTDGITGIIGDGNTNYHTGGKGQYVIATSATLNGNLATPRASYENFVNFTIEDGIPTNLTELTPWDLKNGSITVTVDAAGKQWVQYTNDDNSKQQDDIAWIMQSDNGTATTNTITVETPDDSEHMAKLTLDGVNVNVTGETHAINIGASKAQITLAANSVNTLNTMNGAAIHVTGNLSLVGSGKLNAESGDETAIKQTATIGSGNGEAFGGTMTFGDKVIVSVSNNGSGAAIGSGVYGEMSGHITITGEANIQNASANGGAAIGSGAYGAMNGHITITENAAITEASASNGAAIGSGDSGAMNGHILINTSNAVNAKSVMYTASIGAGRGASMAVGSTITIGSTGTVTAQSGRFGVGIGVGYYSANDVMAGTITIQDSVTVKAYGGKDTAAAIGSAKQGKMEGTINILGTAKVITGNTNLDGNYNIISTSDYTNGTDGITGIIGDGYENYHTGGKGQYVIATSATLNGRPATPRSNYENFVNFTTEDDIPTNLTEITPWDLKNGSITVTVDAAGKQWVQYTNDDNSKQQDDIAWITQSDNGTATANTITVNTPDDSEHMAKLTLDGVNVSVEGDTHAINIGASKAQITLAANSVNTLNTYYGSAIHVTGNLSLVGSGTLNAASGTFGAGSNATIGSGSSEAFGGTMTFGDKVTVSVANVGHGAAIGSGVNGEMSGHITITGNANIQNASANGGAAIGSGNGGAMSGHITITENATITEASAVNGAAIGSGDSGAMNGHILINTSNAVNAKSGMATAGIGAGRGGSMAAGSTITIGSTGTVTAQSGSFGVGIGVGYNSTNDVMAGTITIQDSVTVKAYGGSGAAIGSGLRGKMTGKINLLDFAKIITGTATDAGVPIDNSTGIIGDGGATHHDAVDDDSITIYTIGAGVTLSTGNLSAVTGNNYTGYSTFVNYPYIAGTDDYDPVHLILAKRTWDLAQGNITIKATGTGENFAQLVSQDGGMQDEPDTNPVIKSFAESANYITIDQSSTAAAQLTLDGVKYRDVNRDTDALVKVDGVEATITLAAGSTNTVSTDYLGSAIRVNSGSVIVDGSGKLVANGGDTDSALIGSYAETAFSGSITIEGDVEMELTNDRDAACIGSGHHGMMTSEGEIVINTTGNVTATNNNQGAGIGAGFSPMVGSMAGEITITTHSGQTVTATSKQGAGIGSGLGTPMGGTILIQGDGMVNASSVGYSVLGDTSAGAGIGAGHGAGIFSNGEIIIQGNVTVNAKSAYGGTGIGGGSSERGRMLGTITIQDNAIVNALGGENGAAIGSSQKGGMAYGSDIGRINILGTAKVTTGVVDASGETTSAVGIIGDGHINHHDPNTTTPNGIYTIGAKASLATTGMPEAAKGSDVEDYERFVNFPKNGDEPDPTHLILEKYTWDLAQGNITIKATGEGESFAQLVSQVGGLQNEADANPVITTSEETANYITIDQGNTAAAQLTLDGVLYSDVNDDTDALVKVDDEDAIITLAAGSENTVSTSYFGSAIRVNGGSVTVDGSGKLVANGGDTDSALIGSYYSTAFSGSITIEGDVEMELESGGRAACIGSGYDATINSNGKIVINTTGNVTATSNDQGAGIGSGSTEGYFMYGKITITTHSGQRVTATSKEGAGIGSGRNTLMNGRILIQGDGMVNASCVGWDAYSYAGAGIGAGNFAGISSTGEIIIQGNVTVNAKSRYGGTGIGGGGNQRGRMLGTITIQDNANVTALGGESGAAIGSSQKGGMAYGSDIGRINILGKATVTTGVVDASGETTSAVGIIGDGHINHHEPNTTTPNGIYTIGAKASLATTGMSAAAKGSDVEDYEHFVNFPKNNDEPDPTHLILLEGTWDISRGSITVNVDESGKQTVSQAGGSQNVEDDNPLIYGTTEVNTITVVTAGEKPAQLTLMGVKAEIDTEGVSPLEVGAAKANITLAEGYENTLTGGDEAVGIHVNSGSVTIDGSGTLTATGVGRAAGIGTIYNESLSGSITINGSATVIANGGENGAGIGTAYGGHLNNGSSITINGSATVTAEGGANGAGIGGQMNNGSSITINGSAKVNANGGADGAGIGTDSAGYIDEGASITIGSKEEDTEASHAIVTAKGSDEGTGIGSSGGAAMYGTITIQGFAEVTAYGGSNAAAIGSGTAETMRGHIAIKDNANVTTGNTNGSTDTTYANGARGIIGDGNESHHDVSVGSYTIYTTATLNGLKAITTRNYVNFVNYYIENGVPQNLTIEGIVNDSWDLAQGSITIKATGEGDSYTQLVSQVGGVQDAPDANPIITQTNAEQSTPNTITVDAASTAAAKFTLSGVNVSVTGETHAIDVNEETAEITLAAGTTNRLNVWYGSAIRVSTGELTLTGSGKLEAKGNGGFNYVGAVIGSAKQEAFAGTINIMGNADVMATSAGLSAAIGSGDEGDLSGAINIGGSAKVNATCSGYTDGREQGSGAGIGSGNHGDITTTGSITIEGTACVTASGAQGAAGIGSGMSGSMNGTITIDTKNDVSATSEHYGTGIGSGVVHGKEWTGTIRIIAHSGYTVKATSKQVGAGIGTGYGTSMGGTILIDGDGVVNASSEGIENTAGAGIGAGSGGTITSNGTITIGGSVTVTANSKYNGTGIGTGGILYNGPPAMAGTITIKDTANVTAYGGDNAAAIGSVAQRGMTGKINILGSATVKTGVVNASGEITNAVGIIGDGNANHHDPEFATGIYQIGLDTTLVTTGMSAAVKGNEVPKYRHFVNFAEVDGKPDPEHFIQAGTWDLSRGHIYIFVAADGTQSVRQIDADGEIVQVGEDSDPLIYGGTPSVPTDYRIIINPESEKAAQLTLMNVHAKCNDNTVYVGAEEATITLRADSASTLHSNTGSAIYVTGAGKLTVNGSGKLDASNGVSGVENYSAVIGSGNGEALSGSITLTGDVEVSAKTMGDGGYGAGIGTGSGGELSGSITINVSKENGSTKKIVAESINGAGIGAGNAGKLSGAINVLGDSIVEASSTYGAGIGTGISGEMADGSSITISGKADVTATSTSHGAGIGTGGEGKLSGKIDVQGDPTVTATGSIGAGIGTGGSGEMGGTITINVSKENGSTNKIYATSGSGSGIGTGGEGKLSGTINVQGDSIVEATCNGGAGIGTGQFGETTDASSITISGKADVTATSTSDGAGIGSGYSGTVSGSIIVQGDPIVTATGNNGAGIGTGWDGEMSGTITINVSKENASTNKIVATSTNGAGIGTGGGGKLSGTINVQGDPIVEATGGSGAGIGSGISGELSGTITINVSKENASTNKIVATSTNGAGIGSGNVGTLSGKINVLGDSIVEASSTYGAGIGSGISGEMADTSSISISGNANVTAESTSHGAGIGTGSEGKLSGKIDVQGDSTVTATGTSGAGIGTGSSGEMADGSSINISEKANVTATNTSDGAGIGTGNGGKLGGTINVQGDPSVEATGGLGAGIGSGTRGEMSGTITINVSKENGSTNKIVATSTDGAGIGSGNYGTLSGKINVQGDPIVEATGTNGAGIGAGSGGEMAATITINVSKENASTNQIVATGTNGAAIGSGSGGKLSGTINVLGESIVEASSTYGAGIGSGTGGEMADGSSISISGEAKVTAESTSAGAGIGTGSGGKLSGTINVLGDPSVTATGNGGAGIGTGSGGTLSGTINVQGDSTVEANGYDGAGIGSGSGGEMADGSSINISGKANVIAKNTNTGAGIGTGSAGKLSGNINVLGDPSVTATGNGGAGIGTGWLGEMGGTITINISKENASTNKIVATSTSTGAGIGSGVSGTLSGKIEVLGDSIVESTANDGAGIGTGFSGSFQGTATITISGNANVTAKSTSNGTGIGTGRTEGSLPMAGTITIEGEATVTAYGSHSGAAIGSTKPFEMTGEIAIKDTANVITGNSNGTTDAVYPVNHGIIGDGYVSSHESQNGRYTIHATATLNNLSASVMDNFEPFVNFYRAGGNLAPVDGMSRTWDLSRGDITIAVVMEDGQEVQRVTQGEQTVIDPAPTITGGSASAPTGNGISITTEEGTTAKLTIEGLNVERTSGAAIELGDATAEITVKDEVDGGTTTNALESADAPAIHVSGGELTLIGDGTLEASTSSNGAVIGSNENEDFDGTVSIGESVSITATAPSTAQGAAIGSGANGAMGTGSSIQIGDNANVNATGGASAAAIGTGNGGAMGTGSSIQISDSANVTANGGTNGAAIGTGSGGAMGTGSSIKIDGTTQVTVHGGASAAAIGTGANGEMGASSIQIGGSAIIDATGGANGAAIGTGNGGAMGNGSGIVINESANVTANGGANGAAIGTGNGGAMSTGSRIQVSASANVTANGGTDSAGIGTGNGGELQADANIRINVGENGSVSATGNGNGAGLGGGGNAIVAGNVTIDTAAGATVQITAGTGAAAIGSNLAGGFTGTINIVGNTVLHTDNGRGEPGIIGDGPVSRHDNPLGNFVIHETVTINDVLGTDREGLAEFVNWHIPRSLPPATGDRVNPWVLLAICIASAVGLGACMVVKKKKKQ